MSRLRIRAVDDATVDHWRHVHNTIIPVDPLSHEEVRERVGRNRLEVAYLDDVLIGCTTVRPPTATPATATVIVRVLPSYRRQGYGEEMFVREMALARDLGAQIVETIVLDTNPDGLRFALSHGFAEVARYVPDEGGDAFITLRLAEDASPRPEDEDS